MGRSAGAAAGGPAPSRRRGAHAPSLRGGSRPVRALGARPGQDAGGRGRARRAPLRRTGSRRRARRRRARPASWLPSARCSPASASTAASRSSPADLVATPRQPSRLPRVLKASEAARLLESIPGCPHAGGASEATARPALELRDRALFELAYACGLRAEELVSLRIDDVDCDGEQLRVEGKGRKTRYVPVGELALAALRDYSTRPGRSRPSLARAGALFLSKSDRRLSTSDVRRRLRVGRAGRDRRRSLTAHPAPQLRDAPAGRRRGPAQHPGAARARQRLDDAGIHSGRVREAEKRLCAQPSTSLTSRSKALETNVKDGRAARSVAALQVRRRSARARAPRGRVLAAGQVRSRPHRRRAAPARRGGRPDLLRPGRADLGDRALRPLARDQVRDLRDHAHQGRDHRRAALDGLGAAQRACARARNRARQLQARAPPAARATDAELAPGAGDHRVDELQGRRCSRSRTPRSPRWTSCGASRTPAATRSR